MTKCHRLKLEAADGKKYLTDVASAEMLLRFVQSAPNPKNHKALKTTKIYGIVTFD